MSAVPAGRGEPHGVLPAALCFLASEHSAGVAGKDLLPSVLPPEWVRCALRGLHISSGDRMIGNVFCFVHRD